MEKWGELYLGAVAVFLGIMSLAAVIMTFRGEATKWAQIVDNSPVVDLASVILLIGIGLALAQARRK